MKKFVAPEMVELNINETANGIIDVDFETLVLFEKKEKYVGNGGGCGCHKPTPTPDPVPPERQAS